jgi:hypothetical protein
MKEVRQNILAASDKYLTARTFGTGSFQILIKQVKRCFAKDIASVRHVREEE